MKPKRNFSAELLKFQSTHTFDDNCPKCDGGGYKGKIKEGWERGAYIACDCAKKKMKKTVGGNIPLKKKGAVPV